MVDEQGKSEVPPEDAASPEGPSDEGAFEVDASLEAAMREAEASYERMAREGADPEEGGVEVEVETEGGGGLPAAGAGEGVIRALAEMRKARDELEVTEAKAKDLEERLMRTAADFENFKKRANREREEEKKFAIEKLLKELLPILDNMERAMDAARDAGHEGIVSGIEMVHRQFLDVLGRFSVEQFSALGKPFDPNFHEAMQQQETTEQPPGTVVVEYMKGYTLQGRLVRPAMVVVAKAPEGAAADPPGDPAPADPPAPAAAEAAAAEAPAATDGGGEAAGGRDTAAPEAEAPDAEGTEGG